MSCPDRRLRAIVPASLNRADMPMKPDRPIARRRALAGFGVAGLGLAAILTGCGFEPLYGARQGGSAAADLADIKVNVTAERAGQILRNELLDRLNPRGLSGRPRYGLDVSLRENRTELDVRRDATATFAKLELYADFALTELQSGQVLLRGNSRSVSSYNLLRQTFANLSALDDARARGAREISEDVRIRLADFLASRRAG